MRSVVKSKAIAKSVLAKKLAQDDYTFPDGFIQLKTSAERACAPSFNPPRITRFKNENNAAGSATYLIIASVVAP